MRSLANENVFAPMVQALRHAGHWVTTAQEAGLCAADDDRVYRAAVRGRYVLLTLDKDFCRSRRFNPRPTQGIIVGKLYKMPVDEATRVLVSTLAGLSEAAIRGTLVVVTRTGARVRSGRPAGRRRNSESQE